MWRRETADVSHVVCAMCIATRRLARRSYKSMSGCDIVVHSAGFMLQKIRRRIALLTLLIERGFKECETTGLSGFFEVPYWSAVDAEM